MATTNSAGRRLCEWCGRPLARSVHGHTRYHAACKKQHDLRVMRGYYRAHAEELRTARRLKYKRAKLLAQVAAKEASDE